MVVHTQVIREIMECYNFWRNSEVYNVYSRMRSVSIKSTSYSSSLNFYTVTWKYKYHWKHF